MTYKNGTTTKEVASTTTGPFDPINATGPRWPHWTSA
jgi:hypothetical protein